MHNAETSVINPRQSGISGIDKELFDAYRKAYEGLDNILAYVISPNGTHILTTDVTPRQAIDIMKNHDLIQLNRNITIEKRFNLG